jgi:hypothetical protein
VLSLIYTPHKLSGRPWCFVPRPGAFPTRPCRWPSSSLPCRRRPFSPALSSTPAAAPATRGPAPPAHPPAACGAALCHQPRQQLEHAAAQVLRQFNPSGLRAPLISGGNSFGQLGGPPLRYGPATTKAGAMSHSEAESLKTLKRHAKT